MTRSPGRPSTQAMAERYGHPSLARGRAGVAVIALLAVALLGWAVWAALGRTGEQVGGLVESYDVRSPHLVSVTLQITRVSTDAVRCTVSAIASDHVEVGRQVVRLPPGDTGTTTVTTVVRTEREATSADVASCS